METILSIPGRPGLYRLVSRSRSRLIVESLDKIKRRLPIFATERVTSLANISIYTDSEDIPLRDVLSSMRDKEHGKPCGVDYKKATPEELRRYFAGVLPDYDRDRVHINDIRKLIQWYDILIAAGITDFSDSEEKA